MYSDYVKLEPGKSPLYPDLAKTLDFAVAAPSAPLYPPCPQSTYRSSERGQE